MRGLVAVVLLLGLPIFARPTAAEALVRDKQGIRLELRRSPVGVDICLRSTAAARLSGEFGAVINASAADRGLWRDQLPRTLTVAQEYLPRAFRISLALHDPARLGRSLTVQVGACTVDGGCDILDLAVSARELERLRPQPTADDAWCGPAAT